MTKQVHRAYIPVVIFFVMHFVLKKLSIIQCRFGFKNMFCVVKFYMFSFFPKNKVLWTVGRKNWEAKRWSRGGEDPRVNKENGAWEGESSQWSVGEMWEDQERGHRGGLHSPNQKITKWIRTGKGEGNSWGPEDSKGERSILLQL